LISSIWSILSGVSPGIRSLVGRLPEKALECSANLSILYPYIWKLFFHGYYGVFI
jgi:hypothetical protein